MTGSELYKTFTRVWTGKAMRWGALPKEDQAKWEQVATEVERRFQPTITALQQAVDTLQHNASGGGWD